MYSFHWTIAAVISLFVVLFARRRTRPLPPGPLGKFFVGVRQQIPSSEPWRKYAQWSIRFKSPLIYFRIFNRQIIVLNTSKAAHDLLHKKAPLYSDRPFLWMFHELCKRRLSVFNISSTDDRHRKYRKILQSGLGPRAVETYWPLLDAEVEILLQGFSESPQNYEAHIRRNAAAVIMKMAYGYTVSDHKDFFVGAAEETSRITGYAAQPGRWLVDYYPILRFVPSWIPGAGFKRQAEIWARILNDVSGETHEWVKAQIASGNFENSFTSRLLQPSSGATVTAEEDDIIKWCVGGLYAGAADTTVSAILSFIMLMALHPHIQKRARAEVIDAVGIDRIPKAADISQFTYLLALMKEVFRFAPIGPLALPHKVIEEDEYNGFRIPKDATIIANIWAMMHDPTEYPDPFVFDPDRFLSNRDDDGGRQQADPRSYVFGFGRRTCPGLLFAETSILLIMSCILARFTITSHQNNINNKDIPLDGNGKRMLDFTTGITRCGQLLQGNFLY